MKNIKKLVATLGFMGIIILTNTTAHAGIILSGRAAPSSTPAIERLLNSVRNVVIGQLTGVTMQNRTGIMFSD